MIDQQTDKVIGIVGGMGPMAGHALLNSITRQTKAASDQQHLSVVLMSFPRHITDRTAFLSGSSTDNPAVSIAGIIRRLEVAGAGVIGIACNTAHAPGIFDVIVEALDKAGSRVKLLHMPFETCNYLKKNHSHVRRVGLMTTNGTYRTELYSRLLGELGYEVVVPGFGFQNDVVHRMIYDRNFGIKAKAGNITGEVRLLMDKALLFFGQERADAIILGCTDLSLVLAEHRMRNMLILDSTEVLAGALIKEATDMRTAALDEMRHVIAH